MDDTMSLVPIPQRKKVPLFQPAIVKRAVKDSFVKLNPAVMAKNPVMMVVEVGSVVTSILFLKDLVGGATAPILLFEGQITIWLWFTVLFANFAEAIAEGRGKAQADTLRRQRTETQAKLITGSNDQNFRLVASTGLKVGDVVLVEAGDMIPSDGEVI